MGEGAGWSKKDGPLLEEAGRETAIDYTKIGKVWKELVRERIE